MSCQVDSALAPLVSRDSYQFNECVGLFLQMFRYQLFQAIYFDFCENYKHNISN